MLVLVLGAAPVARAEDPEAKEDPRPSARRAADTILAALAKGDSKAIPFYATHDRPDPWRIAFFLCALGRQKEAEALASSVNLPDLARLSDAIARWKRSKVDPGVLAQWSAIQLHAEKKRWPELLKACESFTATESVFLRLDHAVFYGRALMEAGQ